jgi:cellobiose-specific phosphotransferase system component IIB
MRKLFFGSLLSTLSLFASSQNKLKTTSTFTPNSTVKWAPTGLAVGSLSIQGEYAVGKRTSLTAKIGLPVAADYNIDFDGDDAAFTLKATSFMAGYRIYLSRQQLKGVYFEPFFKYVHHSAEGTNNTSLAARNVTMFLTNDYNAFGVGAQLGAQFRVAKRFVIDLFLIGPEINSASNNFKARETSSIIPWTMIEAQDAERQVKDFIDDFPFVRNHTTVVVDRDNKTVHADFKGALPGFRTGVSFGFAF